ncbi:hypothetical protein V7201_17935 [Bacillus sp. JJ1122]|uniref:hypothetical protein n=1 Tax=Bacillus sp. JJ1122 TaxID=3122951 RepID=UPI002FFFC965
MSVTKMTRLEWFAWSFFYFYYAQYFSLQSVRVLMRSAARTTHLDFSLASGDYETY